MCTLREVRSAPGFWGSSPICSIVSNRVLKKEFVGGKVCRLLSANRTLRDLKHKSYFSPIWIGWYATFLEVFQGKLAHNCISLKEDLQQHSDHSEQFFVKIHLGVPLV
ncbi:hypothetical protein AVEN_215512-1 [Araneus ventricosus]|uniref:Uncharacterized protein n=1 Tax=Araneus ventricosus TaxID=182803 RepID=A0A4Y2BER7_ARAVE|nr:hypothetical protein AVEN_215512-1 [Araneus ventricosus]